MKLFCVNLSWSYSPSKVPRKNHTSSVQNLSRTCAHYYSLSWNILVSQCLVGNSEDFDISEGGELSGDLLRSNLYFFFSVLDTWLAYFRSTTRQNYIYFDFRLISDVAARYYNSALLNPPDRCRPCKPTYRWMSFMYQFYSQIFLVDFDTQIKKNHLRKVTFFDFVWFIKQIFSRKE